LADLQLLTAKVAAGVALISDGYFNNTMTMINVIFAKQYPAQYTAAVKTWVSNALLIGEIFGQMTVGLTCDYLGRKFAIVMTTLMIVLGGILETASHGVTIEG
jgi:MFS family permease